jgi:hypothetical protein
MLHGRLVSLSRHGGGTGIECRICCSDRRGEDQLEPVNPLLMTASISSSETPRRLSIS